MMTCSEDTYQVHNDLTIRVSLECVLLLQLSAEMSMVIDFTIDAKDNAIVLIGKRLSTRICIE
jgi:hypothetical protein